MDAITLITLKTPAPGARPVDRGQGEAHGFAKGIAERAAEAVPVQKFSEELDKVIGQVKAIASKVKDGVADYSADEIKIGLAVTAEGSIGVATVGVEATIEVTLKKRAAAST